MSRNDRTNNLGDFVANYIRGRGDYMGVAGNLNDGADHTAAVYSFWPNDYGLYNMAGNVSEWVMDVYRPLSHEDMTDLNPYRGNVFTDVRRDANGQVVGKDKLGRLYIDTVKDSDVANRYNYQKGDYRNYRDGDLASSINNGADWTVDDLKQGSSRMYVQEEKDYFTLINDNARVYKGGSWRDRAYWLNPSTRRFLDQESCRDDIGFWCAMIRVGSPSGF